MVTDCDAPHRHRSSPASLQPCAAPLQPCSAPRRPCTLILGYGIIAVPTGIVTVELAGTRKSEVTTQACPRCSRYGHDPDAVYCKFCSARLNV
jgi:voltage-gated potassium channel